MGQAFSVVRVAFFTLGLWGFCATAAAQSVTLGWDPSSGASGYTVRWGSALGQFPNSADAGAATSFTLPALQPGATYWAVVEAYITGVPRRCPSSSHFRACSKL